MAGGVTKQVEAKLDLEPRSSGPSSPHRQGKCLPLLRTCGWESWEGHAGEGVGEASVGTRAREGSGGVRCSEGWGSSMADPLRAGEPSLLHQFPSQHPGGDGGQLGRRSAPSVNTLQDLGGRNYRPSPPYTQQMRLFFRLSTFRPCLLPVCSPLCGHSHC